MRKPQNWKLAIGIGNIGGIGNIRFARARLGRQNASGPHFASFAFETARGAIGRFAGRGGVW